ncbi:MAG: amidohydrolase [Gammaproteobacteria bacterium]|nr:amidohydrolase [Gammaproteobacteria bacterium]
MTHPVRSAADIRRRIGHPVIDTDGHIIEFFPAFMDFLKQVAGPQVSGRFWQGFQAQNQRSWHQLKPEERRNANVYRPAFWLSPAQNSLDRATAMLPRLFRERLPELGMDYSFVYPSIGLLVPSMADEELRRAGCRAYNTMVAEMFRGLEDRLTAAAAIPCHTPEEALEELDHAIGKLGLKVPMVGSMVRRPLKEPDGKPIDAPRLLDRGFWVDLLAMDSEYDYDPLWQRCVDLKVPMTFHATTQGIGLRRSTSNYCFNQTGHFAEAGHAYAKALFFGGVTHRFPTLPFAFLECGASWGAQLVCDLKERWEKRTGDALHRLDPRKVDYALMRKLFDQYGGELLAGRMSPSSEAGRAEQPYVDEFAAAGIRNIDDFYERLIPNFYYGCEADDRLAGTAFDARYTPPGRKLRAMFSSDVGHWDVSDMNQVVPESWEMVEDGVMDEADFRDFMFGNPVRLFTSLDPGFFDGTAIQGEVNAMLGPVGGS